MLTGFWYKHYMQVDDLTHVADLHAANAMSIANIDEEGAVTASQEHMNYIQSFTLSTLET